MCCARYVNRDIVRGRVRSDAFTAFHPFRPAKTMMYAVFFEDDDARADMRPKHMAEHLAFLERNANLIRAAGPLRDTASGAPGGGLWLVEAESGRTVRSLVEADPFSATGLRKSVRILEWTQVFADGKRRAR
jgi:hypothetical protein